MPGLIFLGFTVLQFAIFDTFVNGGRNREDAGRGFWSLIITAYQHLEEENGQAKG